MVTTSSVSILIPTIARPTLSRLIREIQPQLSTEDEILVIGDGPSPGARAMVEGRDPRVRYHEHGPTKTWGHSQRNFAMPLAKGDYLMTIDDDDRFSSKGLATIRKAVAEEPGRPLLFRLIHDKGIIWEDRAVRCGNVGTQMIVTPNTPGRLGVWGNRYEGDFDFIVSTLAAYPKDALVWREEILALRGVAKNPAWNERIAKWEW